MGLLFGIQAKLGEDMIECGACEAYIVIINLDLLQQFIDVL